MTYVHSPRHLSASSGVSTFPRSRRASATGNPSAPERSRMGITAWCGPRPACGSPMRRPVRSDSRRGGQRTGGDRIGVIYDRRGHDPPPRGFLRSLDRPTLRSSEWDLTTPRRCATARCPPGLRTSDIRDPRCFAVPVRWSRPGRVPETPWDGKRRETAAIFGKRSSPAGTATIADNLTTSRCSDPTQYPHVWCVSNRRGRVG
jgi:hypothetical protein